MAPPTYEGWACTNAPGRSSPRPPPSFAMTLPKPGRPSPGLFDRLPQGRRPMTTSSPETPGFERSRYRYLVLFILLLVYCLSYVDRQIIGILAVPIKTDLKLSDNRLGLMGGFDF